MLRRAGRRGRSMQRADGIERVGGVVVLVMAVACKRFAYRLRRLKIASPPKVSKLSTPGSGI